MNFKSTNHVSIVIDHVSIVIDLNLFQPDKKHCYDVDDIKRKWTKMESEELLKMPYEINCR